MPSPQQISQAWSKIIAKAWSDESFKQRLMSQPGAVLTEYGVDTIGGHSVAQSGIHIQVIEDPHAQPGQWHLQGRGDKATYIVPIPPKPAAGELGDEALASVAGAGCCCCCCC